MEVGVALSTTVSAFTAERVVAFGGAGAATAKASCGEVGVAMVATMEVVELVLLDT